MELEIFLGSNSSSCLKNSNCNECVGSLSDTSSSCLWCTEQKKCLSSKDTSCTNSNNNNSCKSSYYITIFIIIISSLIFLCCIICLLRKLNRRNNGTLYLPLLGGDNRNNNNSISSDVEWMCTICGFDNKARNKYCYLCGTSHEFTNDYTNEKNKNKKQKQKKKKDIIIPKDAQILENTRLSFSSHVGLSENERKEALNYRRLNQLTLRQKGARRRRMWQRIIDEDTGELVWVRVNFKEAVKSSKQATQNKNAIDSPYLTGSTSQLPSHQQRQLNYHQQQEQEQQQNSLFNLLQSIRRDNRALSFQSNSTAGPRLDSFDAVLNSRSPGYTSYLDPNGQIQWEKLESGSMNVNPSSSYNPNHSRVSTHSNIVHTAYINLLKDLIPNDLQTIIAMSFQDKLTWFYDILTLIQKPFSDGYIRIEINRNNLFEDSFQQLMQIPLEDGIIHRWMRVQFLNEPGIDAGGIEREWFLLITQKIFDKKTGLFSHSGGSSYHINPLSHLIHPEKYLQYYRFTGRLLAKAIMEQQQIPALMSIPLRKHLLGIPITFSDLEFVDIELYRNLCWLKDYDIDDDDEDDNDEDNDNYSHTGSFYSANDEKNSNYDGYRNSNKIITTTNKLSTKTKSSNNPKYDLIEELGLVFSVDYTFGETEDDDLNNNEKNDGLNNNNIESKSLTTIEKEKKKIYKESYELIKNGSDISVNSKNKDEYLELRLRHRMLDSIKLQLESFLVGFYEVLPYEIISVFDYQELELLMCGIPTIDLDDWKRNTEYLGEYYRLGPKHKTIKWFWEVVTSFSEEERIRLLQFTTGCSRLPAKGFQALQSNDGNIRRFNIQSIRKIDSIYPRSHTCFNKLDLPLYSSKAELEAYLSVVINMEVTGFSID